MEKSKSFVALKRLLCSWLLLVWVLFVFCFPTSTAQQMRVEDLSNTTESGICKSVDIRNTINTFEALRGCRVVEGFVQILLFDNVNKSLFENITFPELTEITDYLLLYRVNGLVSLGNLFPNLAVIRGQTLLFGYAFIIFEMSSLQEINLYSLTDITHGLIRIDKNPSLCYVNSIDWSLIAHEKGEHFIKNIKPENECSLCPGDDNTSSKPCPLAHVIQGVNDEMQGRHLCWNRENCQKVCPPNCPWACDKDAGCCSEKCLGGCTNKICNVCKNFTMGTGASRQCMTQCPAELYEYLGRRCVTKEECTNFTKSVEHRIQHEKPYKIFNKSCLLTCPTNYVDDYNQHKCIRCKGKCEKKCLGTNIDSVAAAQQLRDCTHINGSLEIQVRGGRNLLNELEENLKMIEEIDGYIKIVRSYPLVSLNFLKNLRKIHGNVLESHKYVFIVLDNQNLQDIWDWTNRTLQIGRGRLFFHFNPKLCLDKIKNLQIKANLTDYDENEVASSSNGDKIACDLYNLTVNVTIIKSDAVTLKWAAFLMADPRKLLAYLIYTIESPYRNKTLYDNRDACGMDGWTVKDVQITEDNATMQTHLVTGLKPYTQYAFYVKTYTIATERTGAQSKIDYFRTKPSKPSNPLKVSIKSNSSDSLYIKWGPPSNPNGNVTSYIVSGNVTRDDDGVDNSRDYCKSSPSIKSHPETTQITPKIKSNDTCSCEGTSPKSSSNVQKETVRLSQIKFEDELQNKVYIKREPSNTRRKRQLFDDPYKNQNNLTDKNATVKNMTSIGNESYESFSFTVNGTDLYVNKLQHYTYYDITIKACRERVHDDNPNQICSDNAREKKRTEMKKNADNISSGINITNQNATSVVLTWEPPANPNGMILNYQIEYRRIDVESSMPSLQCITRKKWEEDGRIYVLNLIPGNYSVRVKATSQAGDGEFTPEVTFYMEEASRPSTIIFLCVLFFIIVLLVVLCFLRKKCGPNGNNKLITSVNPEYVSTSYVPDDWEVPRKKIELHKELGQGSFGMVYEGVAKDIKGKAQIRCAIKTVNEHATERERIEFLNEASVMKAFDTAHVVKLLGVVSQGQPTLVVMELMANGDLKSYLRSHRPDVDVYDPGLIRQPPTLKRILQMAIQIADGMAYLAAKKYVHRDLAARNCMVAEDLTVKIGDFGMTRDVYETDYYRKGTKGLLPVRWMAPESLKDGVFTSSSDVWSYGVILWEMATLASQPYQGLSNDQVLRYVIDGGIMERPENCPDKLYMLMRCCWKHKPSERPVFLELCTLLLEDACPVFSQVSFYHSAAGMEARSTRYSHTTAQDDPSTPLRIAQEMEDNFALNSSENESEPEGESGGGTHIEFSSYPVPKDSATTANGYLGTNTSNGTTA